MFIFSWRLNLDILSQKPNKLSPFSTLSIQILKSQTNPSSSATQTFTFKSFTGAGSSTVAFIFHCFCLEDGLKLMEVQNQDQQNRRSSSSVIRSLRHNHKLHPEKKSHLLDQTQLPFINNYRSHLFL
ncbi:hypothetical protein QVD17_19752 [Tagetes erecta]|uniref:Uncharacterized protein n=1 Tax=Tagetes erecta TaxID=13708 RepID=A0AAD8KKD5_TARER|nr:hypothetical protein QVD17_19752 [Tagetes erecta]